MKLFKGFALLGALLVLAGCSASGSGGSTGGGGGGSGNGGDSDAFLTAIGKYSKMSGQLNGDDAEITIVTGGKTLTVMDISDPDNLQEMPKFTYVKAVSDTKAEYSQEALEPNALIEILETTATIKGSLYNTGDNTLTLTLVK